MLSGIHQGIVSSFDESTGLGVISVGESSVVPFHCIVISDGTRKITVGSRVTFSVFPALKGRIEAKRVEKL